MTLPEVIVMVAIMGLMFGLLVPSIQSARQNAILLKSKNNVRQLAAGMNSAFSKGLKPYYTSEDVTQVLPADYSPALAAICEVVGYKRVVGLFKKPDEAYLGRVYQSPADPSLVPQHIIFRGDTSYVVNWCLFNKPQDYRFATKDGVSNTILYCEQYANCQGNEFHIMEISSQNLKQRLFGPSFRPTYADYDNGHFSVIPGPGGRAVVRQIGNLPAKPFMFQVAPKPEDCSPFLPATPHKEGMITGFADGSVRTLGPNTSPEVFAALTTPNGGEVIGDS